jgi:hypothetical protein
MVLISRVKFGNGDCSAGLLALRACSSRKMLWKIRHHAHRDGTGGEYLSWSACRPSQPRTGVCGALSNPSTRGEVSSSPFDFHMSIIWAGEGLRPGRTEFSSSQARAVATWPHHTARLAWARGAIKAAPRRALPPTSSARLASQTRGVEGKVE